MTTKSLRIQYSDNLGRVNRLRETMVVQLTKLLQHEQIALGVPMESRVKAWNSVEDKLERKNLSATEIEALDDLVGIRLILLFHADLEAVEKLITHTFEIMSNEDTSKRLGEDQFGYQSQHFVLKLPQSWLAIPSMTDLAGLRVEVQVRTLAQHIWAAASHKLQYKHETSVPPPLRRTMYRVSALLETVDLEFDRVLAERKNYREVGIAATAVSEPLNVDLLAAVLSDTFPPENHMDDENTEDLLADLRSLSIQNVDELRAILNKHRDDVIEAERTHVKEWPKDCYVGPTYGERLTQEERIRRGVFYTHVGLARAALCLEFGDEADALFQENATEF